MNGDVVQQILTRPVQLVDQVRKTAGESLKFRPLCLAIQSKARTLAGLIGQAALVSKDQYESPTRKIINNMEQVLENALILVEKCCKRPPLWTRLFTIDVIPNDAFGTTLSQLDNTVGDVTWLIHIYTSKNDNDNDDDCDGTFWGLPPICSKKPMLCCVWEHIAKLSGGSLEERSDAAASLVSLVSDSNHYRKLIIEEGGVVPLLRLVKEGKQQGQENACRAIGLLGRHPDSGEHLVKGGVGPIFAKILKEGNMNNQVMVAWAVSELAANNTQCQDHFAENNVICLLVGHLGFDTIQEDENGHIANRAKTNVQSETSAVLKPERGPQVAQTQAQSREVQDPSNDNKPNSDKGIKSEDPVTKVHMKAMVTRALWSLARGNVATCRTIIGSIALLCLAVLVEKGPEEVKDNCRMVIMEITAMAEENTNLPKMTFN